MLTARDYVEVMTCNRLNRKRKDDRFVSEQEFLLTKKHLENLIYKMARVDNIPGFDPYDLEGFFCMQIHQSLRRNKQYNNEFSYFARSFQNLLRNLVKEQKTAEKRLHQDPIREYISFNEINKMF